MRLLVRSSHQGTRPPPELHISVTRVPNGAEGAPLSLGVETHLGTLCVPCVRVVKENRELSQGPITLRPASSPALQLQSPHDWVSESWADFPFPRRAGHMNIPENIHTSTCTFTNREAFLWG